MPITFRTISYYLFITLFACLSLPAPRSLADSIESNLPPDATAQVVSPDAADGPEEIAAEGEVRVDATIQPLPSPVAATDDVIVSAFRFTHLEGFDYVELFNTSDKIADVRNVSLKLLYSDTASDYECSIVLDGHILPQRYVTFAQSTSSVTPLDAVYPMNGCASPASEAFDKEIQVYRNDQLIESVRITAADFTPTATLPSKAWVRGGFTASYRKGGLATDFREYKRSAAGTPDIVYTSALYAPPLEFTGLVTEILPNPGLCTVSDIDVRCDKYIKIINTSDAPLNLANYRLRSGARGERPSMYNMSYLTGVIMPGSYLVVSHDSDGNPLAIDTDEAATWFEDAYGVTSYESGASLYTDGDTVANQGRSWAYVVDDEGRAAWQWTTAAPLTMDNVYYVAPVVAIPGKGALDVKPCRDGQYRSEETGRCRSIALAGDTLTPCKEGQYRSEETNRCRSIATTVAAELKPCGEDQFRNPLTGRCKKIASVEDILQPCDAGYERNLTTNRCRKVQVTDMPLAAFPVEAVEQSTTSALGWWALGGVSLLAAGRGVWEWRHELGGLARRIVSRGTTSGK